MIVTYLGMSSVRGEVVKVTQWLFFSFYIYIKTENNQKMQLHFKLPEYAVGVQTAIQEHECVWNPPSGCKEIRVSSFPDWSRLALKLGLLTACPSLTRTQMLSPITNSQNVAVYHRKDKHQNVWCLQLLAFRLQPFSCLLFLKVLWLFCAVFFHLCHHKSFVAPAVKLPLLIEGDNCPPYILVCSALCSTPTHSCSEELLQHSTSLAAKDSANQDVVTLDKKAPALKQEMASVGTSAIGAKLLAEQESLTSPQNTCIPSPSHFLPGSTGLATTDTSQHQGKARSESEDPPGGASRMEHSLRATWAPSSYNTLSWMSTSLSQHCRNPWLKIKDPSSIDDLKMAWASCIVCMETEKKVSFSHFPAFPLIWRCQTLEVGQHNHSACLTPQQTPLVTIS